MNRSMKLALYTTAALLFAAGHAVAGGPPPHAGGPGGPGNAGAFDGWAGGSVMSGSANEFGFSADFRDVGAFAGGVAATGWNSGQASVGASFGSNSFDAWANSHNEGGMIGGGAGFGAARTFDMNVGSFGQSFGEVEFNFGN